MATQILCRPQSTTEVRTYDCDFADDLRTGVTLSSATATHTPPSGSATNPTVGAVATPRVPVTVGPLSALGMHQVLVLGTLSDNDKSSIMLLIPVNA